MRVRKPLVATGLVAGLVAASVISSVGMSATADSTTPGSDAPETTVASTAPAAEPTTTAYVPPARGAADLVIWADDTRVKVLKPLADKFAADEGIKVDVQFVPFDKIRDNLSKQGPAGEGPDIVIGAPDWLGSLVADGAVAPMDLSDADKAKFADVAIKAFTYDGKVYGLPYAIENVALIRNTDLVPEAPKTFEDLAKTALELKAAGKVEVPLAIQEGPADVYHNYPLYSMTGANVFAQNADGTFDPTKLGLDSPEAIESAKNFAKWAKDGLINKDVTYDTMITSFGEGKAPFAITGPWAVSEADRGFKAKGVKYVVEPIPPLTAGGKAPAVFVGVQGFMISAFSKKADLAKTFLTTYINTEQVQLDLSKAGGRPPAMKSVFEQVKSDADVAGFGAAGQNGVPMPAIPAMGSVWDAWKDAYATVFTGGDPEKAFKDAAAAIRAKIGG